MKAHVATFYNGVPFDPAHTLRGSMGYVFEFTGSGQCETLLMKAVLALSLSERHMHTHTMCNVAYLSISKAHIQTRCLGLFSDIVYLDTPCNSV